jgi:anti-sigma factor RsiW
MTAMTGPACRQIRQLLGVYIVGAIDPAERSIVDIHLSSCPTCREELSGLAGLPALLGRVPREDVERMDAGGTSLPDPAEPSAELLNSLLRRVSVTRRTRRVRSVLGLAAAVAIAAGGTGVAVNALGAPHPFSDSAQATNGEVTAVVDYSSTSWGTVGQIGVSGVQTGQVCALWAKVNGKWVPAGGWRADGPGYIEHWYPVSAHGVNARDVHGFKITTQPPGMAHPETLLTIPEK